MKILVTRPREDAETLAAPLRERGLEAVVQPVLKIAPILGVTVETEGVQGILATSANGIRALADALADRSLPVWAVGDATARTARQLGYEQVESAGGDVFTLAELVIGRCRPDAGALLHAAGTVTAGDLSGRLEAKGFAVRRVVLYEARPVESLPDSLAQQLRAGEIGRALFYSPRTAETFVALAKQAGLEEALSRITAHALSQAVADKLIQVAWAGVRVASQPTQDALLATLDPAPAEKPAPEAAAAPAAVHEEPGLSWKPVAAALGLIVLIGGGVLGWAEWRNLSHPASAPAPAAVKPPEAEDLRAELAATRERLQSLEARLSQGTEASPLEGRLTQAEAALRTLQNQPQLPARLSEDMQALTKQVGELQRNSADAATVLRLVDRVEKVEAQMRELQARRAAAATLLLAVGQLREAANAALPYDGELRALRALAPEDAEVARATDALKARAAAGIPSRAALVSRFESLAPAIIRAQALPAEAGVLRQSLNRVASLISVRREDGEAAGDSAAALTARTAARLADNDLAAAIAEAERLPEGAAEAAAPWLADAKARLAADKALSDLTAHVVAAVGAKP